MEDETSDISMEVHIRDARKRLGKASYCRDHESCNQIPYESVLRALSSCDSNPISLAHNAYQASKAWRTSHYSKKDHINSSDSYQNTYALKRWMQSRPDIEHELMNRLVLNDVNLEDWGFQLGRLPDLQKSIQIELTDSHLKEYEHLYTSCRGTAMGHRFGIKNNTPNGSQIQRNLRSFAAKFGWVMKSRNKKVVLEMEGTTLRSSYMAIYDEQVETLSENYHPYASFRKLMRDLRSVRSIVLVS
jgi:hypothetical protein